MVNPMPSCPPGDPDEPDWSFRSARLKVRWAEVNINQLQLITERFLKRHDETGGLTPDGKGMFHSERIPAHIVMYAGDAIFSLRSALDCCWMGLRRAIKADETKGTLPRGDTRKEVIGTVKGTLVEHAFKGTDELIADKIRPYRDGNEILWFGGKVDNWNKHNMLVVAVQRSSGNIRLRRGSGTITITGAEYEGHIPAGLMQSADIPFELDPDHKPNISSEIILISRVPVDERPLMPFLSALLKETHEAVELFVSTFGKKATESPKS